MSFAIRNWVKYQGSAGSSLLNKRVKRGTDPARPWAMGYLNVVTSFDEDFAQFAALVGGRAGESFFIRVLQYVGKHDPLNGICDVPRDGMSELVLARRWDTVSARVGARVHDAMIASNLAVLAEPRRGRVPSAVMPSEQYRAEQSRAVGASSPAPPVQGPAVAAAGMTTAALLKLYSDATPELRAIAATELARRKEETT